MISCDICGKDSTMSKIFEREGRAFYRCFLCGLEKIFPQPSDVELQSIYNNEYYEAWGRLINAAESVKKETFRARLKLLPKNKNKNILDCGCAAGYLLEEAQEQGFVAYGIDINPAGLEIARQKFQPSQICQGRLEESQFPDSFFYAIFLNDFLEHVRNPIAVLELTYRMLEPGGFLVITTPDVNSFSRKITGAHWPHYKSEHLFYFYRRAVRICLSRANFLLTSVNKAWKCLTLDYISAYFNKYPQKIITLLSKSIYMLPLSIRFKKIWFSLGEMVILARKPCR
jgi:2-polyprenyl-3-methyl-5-hydroxy-6-metoxy-1,4-benzoquinol methylase